MFNLASGSQSSTYVCKDASFPHSAAICTTMIKNKRFSNVLTKFLQFCSSSSNRTSTSVSEMWKATVKLISLLLSYPSSFFVLSETTQSTTWVHPGRNIPLQSGHVSSKGQSAVTDLYCNKINVKLPANCCCQSA